MFILQKCWMIAIFHLLLTTQPGHGMAFTVFTAVMQYYKNIAPGPIDAVPDTTHIKKQYDFIVVGAGSGGSVVANRLTEIPDWTVLLLEAGGEENVMSDIPLLVSYLLDIGYDWGYRTERQPGICSAMKDRRCRWPRGKAMGGSSVINYMMYTRGVPEDYDNWVKLGNQGWSYADVLPYFKKSEDVGMGNPLSLSPYHGIGGYLKVQEPKWRTTLAPVFLKAGQELGYSLTDDYNGQQPLGFSYVQSNTDFGRRCSASKSFLRPIRQRHNLSITKKSFVTKILIDPITKRAYGIKFIKNGRTITVLARKEVIICGGTINTPQLLMLSGIGPADHLKEIGIPLIEDLKVGFNLQDHASMAGLVFLVNQSVTIVESRYRHPKYLLQYTFKGEGPYTIPGGAEAVAFTVTKYAKNSTLVPDMELVFAPGALTGDTGGSLQRLLGIDDLFYEQAYGHYRGQDAWGLVPILLRPNSRGRIKLRSANPFQFPLLYANYFTDPQDRRVLIEGIKQVTI